MAYITGKFGNVQRVLPTEYKEGVPVWADRNNFTGTGDDPSAADRGYIWTTNGAEANRWTIKARPTVDGLVKSVADYSNTVSAIKSWKMENIVNAQSYAASNTRGFNAKFAGTRNASGSFDGIGGFPPLNPGDRFLFRGFVGPESGSNIWELPNVTPVERYADIAGFVYQVAAIATGISININYGTFAPLEWSVNWTSDWTQNGDELLALGIPTLYSTKAALAKNFGFYDQTPAPCNEALPSTEHMLVVSDDRPANATEAKSQALSLCLESANLTFNTQTNPSANSCSAGAGGWQTSTIGTTDVQLQTQIHGSNYGVLYSQAARNQAAYGNINGTGERLSNVKNISRLHLPGVDRYVRIYIGNYTEPERCGCWEFNKLFVGSYTGLNVDVQSGAIVSFGTQMEFNAFPRKNNVCEKGFIRYRLPGGAAGKEDYPTSAQIADSGWVNFVDLTEDLL